MTRLLDLLKWLFIASLVGLLSGGASAALLKSLEWVTQLREANLWLIALLPIAGLALGLIYHHFGKSVEEGNNLLLEEIHESKNMIPFRMAPLILVSTLVTHLFGGSAGREGTAVQMAGALADQLTRPFRFLIPARKVLLMTGISAGFSSIFGTPIAGAVFGLEVLTQGRMRYEAIFPCFVAAIIADQVTRACGIHHDVTTMRIIPVITAQGLGLALIAGVLFGVLSMFFTKSTHLISNTFKKYISYAPLRPFIGGIVVALGVLALGTRYIGLGIPTINDALTRGVLPWDFLGKFVFTTLTLGSGFKGGEVTPLFFIGATFGNTLSRILALPSTLLADMGFVAVFAGAAKTPLTSILMALELFGPGVGVFAGIACVASYLFSGDLGIYHSQRRDS